MPKSKSKSTMDCRGFLPIETLESCELPPAYYEGAEAAEENKGSRENPYPVGTTGYNVWSIGFTDGLEENRYWPQDQPSIQEGGGL
jgi:hypothetical protein